MKLNHGERLRRWRRSKGWTQRKLARVMGVSVFGICRREKGVTPITVDFEVAAAKAMRVPLRQYRSAAPRVSS